MNSIRNGNITSSEIAALLSRGKAKDTFGAPAFTYIKQCNMERRLGRSLDVQQSARPLTWGKCLEPFAFAQLGLEYTLTSDRTIVHPAFPYWVGSPDGMKHPGCVTDIKCPYTLQSFCELVDCINMVEVNGVWQADEGSIGRIRENHRDGEKYYWQLVSNAILEGVEMAELIIFMPYKSELDKVREQAGQMDPGNAYAWIGFAYDEDLPYLMDGGHYRSINKVCFKIPDSDRQLLIESVSKAGNFLQPLTAAQVA